MICPFCQESDFDLVGLKHHLTAGECDQFNETVSIDEEASQRREAQRAAK